MSSLRQEIEQEMQSVRIDKTRLFNLLLKMVDGCGGGGGACLLYTSDAADE